MKNRKKIGLVAFIICAMMAVSLLISSSAAASTYQDLVNQKNSAAAAKLKAEQEQAKKEKDAAVIQSQISIVANNIASTTNALSATGNRISETEQNIGDLKDKIKAEEDKLAKEKERSNSIISSWYMKSETGLLMAVLGSDSLSDVVTEQEQYASIQNQIKETANQIEIYKGQLSAQKDEQNRQLIGLEELKQNQENQKKELNYQKNMKNRLLTDTKDAISDLSEQQAAAAQKIKEIDAKIAALSATKAWGTEIVSSNDSSWYYTQTGNFTRLGNSPYTVSQYGCLITSIAMVATFKGHRISPTDIAQDASLFDSGGGLSVTSPPGIGVYFEYSKPINWGIVTSEINSGNPVIVSIFLPSVGTVNADGSSHFVVIKGKSGDKYLMHDPIGDGRGYNISQVRSMKLLAN